LSTLADIRAAIVAKFSGVPNIGLVHAYERYAKSEGEFRDLYVAEIGGQKLIRGWYVRRLATREVSAMLGLSMRITTWRVVGYHGLDDPTQSEIVFNDLVEAVCDAFRTDPTLGGIVADTCDLTAGSDDKPQGVQVEDFAQVLLAQKLCHRVQLMLTTSNPLQY
jgi:hypothetical protein